MKFYEILLIGIGLSMDAFAVSLTNGMQENKMRFKKVLLIAGFFGIFQGVMPIIGFYVGSIFAHFIEAIAPYVALVLLGFIGIDMIIESFKKEPSDKPICNLKTLTLQAIATSIDALACGITFVNAAGNNDSFNYSYIFYPASIIAITTFVLSIIAVLIGKKFGDLFKSKAKLIGGLILFAIGLKIFIQGVFF